MDVIIHSVGNHSVETSNRSRFKTLAKLFSNAISPKHKDNINRVDHQNYDENEFLYDYKESYKSFNVEKEIHESINEWKISSEVSIAVTGDKGVGKSHLINTLLEATSLRTYENNDTFHNDRMDIENENNDQSMCIEYDGNNKKHATSSMKLYKKMTSYDFNSDKEEDKDSSKKKNCKKGFSVKDIIKEHTAIHQSNLGINETEEDIPNDNRTTTYKNITLYAFNSNQNHNPHQYEVNIGPIQRDFVPDDHFFNSIDWEQEKRDINEHTLWYEQKTMYANDFHSFLLPQGQTMNIPQLVSVRYGKIPELIVSFPEENEIRTVLWELHTIDDHQHYNEEHIRILEARYRCLLDLNDNTPIPLQNITSPQDLPLSKEVRMLAGKNFRFKGLGRSFDQDRVFIREKLRESAQKFCYHMCKFRVRIPSSLLEGNKEITDISGPYLSSDFQLKRSVENANLFIVVLDKLRGLNSELSNLLNFTGLGKKMITNPDLYRTIFVELTEKYKFNTPADLLSPSIRRQSNIFKEQLILQWKNILTKSSNLNIAPKYIESALAKSNFVTAYPTLFKNLCLRENFPTELIENVDIKRVLTATYIPSLMASIPNHVFAKMGMAVKRISHFLLMNKRIHQRPMKSQTKQIIPLDSFKQINLTYDSNSQFRALCHQVYGTEDVHYLLRLLIVSEIITNSHLYEPIVSKMYQDKIDVREYANMMTNESCRGDQITLKAFTNVFSCNLCIYSFNNPEPFFISFSTRENQRNECINTYYIYITSDQEHVSLVDQEQSFSDKSTTNSKKRIRFNDEDNENPISNYLEKDQRKKSKVTQTGSPKQLQSNVPSLVDICLDKIVDNLDKFVPFNCFISEEIRYRILDIMIKRNKISDNNIKYILDPDMTCMTIKGPCTNITDISISHISTTCKFLKKVCFSNLNLTDKGIIQLANNSPMIEYIDLSRCISIGNAAIQEISKKCTQIKHIDISGCNNITDISLINLTLSCPELETIIAQNCHNITDSAFQFISNQIKYLDLMDCTKLTDEAVISILNRCINLEYLNLSFIKNITYDSFLSVIEYPKNLKTLNISHLYNLTEEGIAHITEKCPNLVHLNIAFNEIVSNESLYSIAHSCRQLKSINISKCTKVDDDGLIEISKYCKNLKKLDISNLTAITSKSLERILEQCTGIKHLNASMTSVDDEFLIKYSKNLKNLKSIKLFDTRVTSDGILHLSKCSNLISLSLSGSQLNDKALLKLSQYCPLFESLTIQNSSSLSFNAIETAILSWHRLTDLNLRGIHPIDSDSFETFSIKHPSLENLSLSWCKFVDDRIVKEIASGCPKLVNIDLAWCVKITSSSVYELSQKCVNLRSLNIRGCTNVGLISSDYSNRSSSILLNF